MNWGKITFWTAVVCFIGMAVLAIIGFVKLYTEGEDSANNFWMMAAILGFSGIVMLAVPRVYRHSDLREEP